MSIIHVRQIQKFLETQLTDLIDLSDFEGKLKQDNHLFLTRALSAFALHLLARIELEDAANCIVDGANDNGIDAVYIDESNNRLYVVQSKWIDSGKGEPDLGSVKKFADGITDLINLKFDRFNDKLSSKASIIRRALEDPSFRMSVVLVHTGVEGPAIHAHRTLADLIDSLNDANEVVELNLMKQPQLHKGLTQLVHGEPISLDITMTSWGRKSEPYPAWYGQVSANQIAEWWNDYHDQLFSRNLRGLLSETEINSEIRGSLIETPDLFWYFNNGITLIAANIDKPLAHSGNNEVVCLHCSDISVVNGAQTVGSIGRFSSNSMTDLSTVTVPVRIIAVGDAEEIFGKSITRSNNRQNRIENRDFVALDPEQIRLQEELATDGISYQLLRVGEFVSSDSAFDVVEATVALSCASGEGRLAVQVKREISKLWDDLSKAPYRRLFNPSVSGSYVWRCILTQRQIDHTISEIISSGPGNQHLHGVLIHGNRVLSALIFSNLEAKKFNQPKYPFEETITQDIIEEKCQFFANKLAAGIDQYFPTVPLPTLFKNANKCLELIEVCKDVNSSLINQMALDFSS